MVVIILQIVKTKSVNYWKCDALHLVIYTIGNTGFVTLAFHIKLKKHNL